MPCFPAARTRCAAPARQQPKSCPKRRPLGALGRPLQKPAAPSLCGGIRPGEKRAPAQAPDVLAGRITEKALVFAVELADALIAHGSARAACVYVLSQHKALRLMQPEPLLELNRTQSRGLFEVPVENGGGHVDFFRQLFNPHGRGKIFFQPEYCLRHLVGLGAGGVERWLMVLLRT